MSDTIRADAPKIATGVTIFRAASDTASTITWDGIAADLDSALEGGSAVAAAMERVCGASSVAVSRCAARGAALSDFAHETHRFLELTDEDFANTLARVVGR